MKRLNLYFQISQPFIFPLSGSREDCLNMTVNPLEVACGVNACRDVKSIGYFLVTFELASRSSLCEHCKHYHFVTAESAAVAVDNNDNITSKSFVFRTPLALTAVKACESTVTV